MMTRPASREPRETHRPVAKRAAVALAVALGVGTAIATVSMAGCGTAEEPPPVSERAPAMPAAAAAQDLDITYKSEPDPPKTGDNQFEVTVTDEGGTPVTDADVSVVFYMAAMPSRNMPEMRNSIPLQHDGNGRYRGTGNVVMAGGWDVTVVVKRGETEIGNRMFKVTAQ